MTRRETTVSRRHVLLGAVGGVAGSLAGCVGEGESEPPAGPRSSPSGTGATTVAPVTTPGPTAKTIAETAVPIRTIDPAASADDLGPLADKLDAATVLALGEATHGTREFFALKDRLIRFLVTELGVRTIAWEGGFAQSRRINDFVRDGEGTAESALSYASYGVWRTESVLRMLRWLRSYNRSRPEAENVSFYGIDTQLVIGPATRLRNYVDAVDVTLPDSIDSDLAWLATNSVLRADTAVERNRGLRLAGSVVDGLRKHFDAEEAAYVSATSQSRLELARRDLWTMDRARVFVETYREDDDIERAYEIRDEAMAANVTWLLEQTDTDRIVVWAHNAHVKDGAFDFGERSADAMGHHLARAYGDDYYALATEFGSGSFRAKSAENGEYLTFSVASPVGERPLATTFSQVAYPRFVLDFDSVSNPDLRRFLDGEHDLYTAGWQVDPEDVETYSETVDLTDAYDGVLFVEETTAAEPSTSS